MSQEERDDSPTASEPTVECRRPSVRDKLRPFRVVAKMRAPTVKGGYRPARMNAARYDDPADDPVEEVSDEQRRQHRLRFELIFASLWLAFGLFLLPALVFWVGGVLLGPYGENAGLSKFYVDFYGDLAEGSGRAWTVALGPVVLLYLLRALFIGVQPKRVETEEPRSAPATRREPLRPSRPVRKDPKKPATRAARVEPRMGQD